jgi:hypothetical protein
MNQDLTNEDKYKEKYLKYKIKYIRLKQIEANDFNKNSTEDEYKQKYLKYKKKYLEFKQIGAYNDEKTFYWKRYYNIIYFLTSKKQLKSIKKILLKMNRQPDYSKLVKKNKTQQILTINHNKVVAITAKNWKKDLWSTKANVLNSRTGELDESLGEKEWMQSEINEKANEEAEKTEEKAYDIFEKWLEENEDDKRNIMIVMGFLYDMEPDMQVKINHQWVFREKESRNYGKVYLKTVTIKR